MAVRNKVFQLSFIDVCIQYTITSRALGLVARGTRKQRYLAYNIAICMQDAFARARTRPKG